LNFSSKSSLDEICSACSDARRIHPCMQSCDVPAHVRRLRGRAQRTLPASSSGSSCSSQSPASTSSSSADSGLASSFSFRPCAVTTSATAGANEQRHPTQRRHRSQAVLGSTTRAGSTCPRCRTHTCRQSTTPTTAQQATAQTRMHDVAPRRPSADAAHRCL
jgi:hypothetical protein